MALLHHVLCVPLCGICVQVVEAYSEELGLGKPDSQHSHAIVAAHGAKKLAAVVAAVRTVQFMDRCVRLHVGRSGPPFGLY